MALADQLKKYRISQAEYQKICDLLGREPQGVEWPIYSALWSEHCSYKSSKVHLQKLFNKHPRVLQSFGENAGIVDLGQGEKVAFKMESHNHPSFIEPFQGAATGVGGILRDIFTMGARPIALANYLCFGEPAAPRMSYLVNGVVRGIGGYGNCVGVPNVTGQTHFHKSYNGNILVNAMAVGLFGPGDPILLSQATGKGNLVVYVGAKTGRDGVHGASMASASFDENSAAQLPTVQIGDPFYEKLLIESCLEVMKKGLVVAIQDMGAAGLISSSFEMAEKGKVGLDLYLDRVPLRDSSMQPEDILLSESQERMLLICVPDKYAELQKVFAHWGLDSCEIGQVIDEPVVRLNWQGEVIAEISPEQVIGQAPQYQRPFTAWSTRATASGAATQVALDDTRAQLMKILASVDGGRKNWIYEQYDQRVGARTLKDCAEPLGVVALPSGRALGIALGCRPHVMRFDALIGGLDSIFYPSLELAVKGFMPLAVTDCLNFANPEKPAVMSEFVAALTGMNQACTAMDTPIISGNVSFYNETKELGITPTPSTGLVGLRDTCLNLPGSSFMASGDEVYLARWGENALLGLQAELVAKEQQGCFTGELPSLRLFVDAIREFVQHQPVTASRVVGNFGLGYALARMTLAKGLGAEIVEQPAWFSEPLYAVVLTLPAGAKLGSWTSSAGTLVKIGQVKGSNLHLGSVKFTVREIKEAYEKSWPAAFPELS